MRRDFAISRAYRLAFAMDLAFGVIDLAFYYFISKTFEGAVTQDLGGAPSYFAFVTVGLAITVVIGATSAQLAQRVREEQLTGTLEAVVSQPLSPAELALGMGALPFVGSVVRAAFYLVVATALLGADFSQADWLGFVVVLLATAAALSGLGVAMGALVLVVKRGVTAVSLVTFAMGLLGGAFFPVSVLPELVAAPELAGPDAVRLRRTARRALPGRGLGAGRARPGRSCGRGAAGGGLALLGGARAQPPDRQPRAVLRSGVPCRACRARS